MRIYVIEGLKKIGCAHLLLPLIDEVSGAGISGHIGGYDDSECIDGIYIFVHLPYFLNSYICLDVISSRFLLPEGAARCKAWLLFGRFPSISDATDGLMPVRLIKQ